MTATPANSDTQPSVEWLKHQLELQKDVSAELSRQVVALRKTLARQPVRKVDWGPTLRRIEAVKSTPEKQKAAMDSCLSALAYGRGKITREEFLNGTVNTPAAP